LEADYDTWRSNSSFYENSKGKDYLLKVKWLNSESNSADLFTKNLGGPLFTTHTLTLCGPDDYYAYN
jgi:hypothetical protein